ncbi:hypothetical protein H7F15_05615 [Pontibacter sp. Tf4]|uniref:hypothetical protein n=1 Tax=Pontibacter sp. Tf4 TaxID=2761620 RepID=UPI001623E7CF|nr:hypothetical protein [Pontibacter sp. Tf4]MBB6610505.1 hypothetical protein [Pontibacter sp. Tf4]
MISDRMMVIEVTPQTLTSAPDVAPKQAKFNLSLDAHEKEQAEELYYKLREPLFTVAQAGVTQAMYADWLKAGIVAEVPVEAAMPFTEYLWLRLARDLHSQGLPVERIKVIRDYLFTRFKINGKDLSPALLDKVRIELSKLMKPAEVTELLELVKTGQLDELLHTFGIGFTQLEAFIYAALYRKQEVGLMLFSTGELAPWLDEMQGMGPEGKVLQNRTHVYLSITQHLTAYLLDDDKIQYIPRLSLLSEEELQVIRAIRNKSLKQVTVSFDEKRSMLLTTTMDGLLDERTSTKVKDAVGLKNFQKIQLQHRGGDQLYFSREQKRRV